MGYYALANRLFGVLYYDGGVVRSVLESVSQGPKWWHYTDGSETLTTRSGPPTVTEADAATITAALRAAEGFGAFVFNTSGTTNDSLTLADCTVLE